MDQGIDCLGRFNGMFAFGLWDGGRQRLFLARDRVGVKPLYYTLDRNRIAFGSTAKAVTAFADVSREISPEAMDLYFQMAYIPAPPLDLPRHPETRARNLARV